MMGIATMNDGYYMVLLCLFHSGNSDREELDEMELPPQCHIERLGSQDGTRRNSPWEFSWGQPLGVS